MKFSLAFLSAVSADLSQEFYERRIVINSHLNVKYFFYIITFINILSDFRAKASTWRTTRRILNTTKNSLNIWKRSARRPTTTALAASSKIRTSKSSKIRTTSRSSPRTTCASSTRSSTPRCPLSRDNGPAPETGAATFLDRSFDE